MVAVVAIFKDVISDITGGTGILGMSVPIIADVNGWLQLLCTCGGAVLLYFSIRYKILLYRNLKRKEEEEENTKKYFKK